MKYREFLAGCTLVLALQSGAFAAAEASGYGKATFGMKVDAVKEIYPALELSMAAPEQKPDEFGVPLSIYRLTGEKIDKLTCNIDFKFLNNILSYLDFYCAAKEDVPAYLEATYGPPATKGDTGWLWTGQTSFVSYAPSVGTFTVTSKRANDALQGSMFLRYLVEQGQQQQQQPQQAAPPAGAGAPQKH